MFFMIQANGGHEGQISSQGIGRVAPATDTNLHQGNVHLFLNKV